MSRLNINKLSLLILISSIYNAFSQQELEYSLYGKNLNLINPSFAGQEATTKVLLNSKLQWIGIEDAPIYSVASINVPLYKNLGMGLSFANQKTYILNQTGVMLDGAYKVQLSSDYDLLFGMKASLRFSQANLESIPVKDNGDAYFSEIIDGFESNFDFGLALKHKHYFVHIAVGNVVENPRKIAQGHKRFVGFGGGTKIELTDYLNLVPSTYINIKENSPLLIDVNTSFEIMKSYKVSASYRYQNSIQVSCLIPVLEWGAIGYGYTIYTGSELISEQKGAHQFMLLFTL